MKEFNFSIIILLSINGADITAVKIPETNIDKKEEKNQHQILGLQVEYIKIFVILT